MLNVEYSSTFYLVSIDKTSTFVKRKNETKAGIKIAVMILVITYTHTYGANLTLFLLTAKLLRKKERNKFMKITSDDIRAIPVNTSTTFIVDNPRQIDVAKSLAYRLNALESGKRYTCKSDFAKRRITITARVK